MTEEVNCSDNKTTCCNNDPKPYNEEKVIRILINTAGDELENFTLLGKKINEDFNFFETR